MEFSWEPIVSPRISVERSVHQANLLDFEVMTKMKKDLPKYRKESSELYVDHEKLEFFLILYIEREDMDDLSDVQGT